MKITKNKYRGIIVQGWVGMFLLLLSMFITDYVEFSIQKDFSELITDPGITGLWALSILMCINALVQISIRTFSGNLFRWFIFVLTLLYTLFFMGHQVSHALNGGISVDIHLFLEFTHHILGTWATIIAYKWIKEAT